MTRLATCKSSTVTNISGKAISLQDDVVILDYPGTLPVSIVWQVDHKPITAPLEIFRILSGPAHAHPLPPLGVFATAEIEGAIARGEIVVTNTL